MYTPSLDKFCELFKGGGRVPVMREMSLRDESSVSVIEKLGLAGSPLCLLESGKGLENLARHSFLGFSPHCIFRSMGDNIEITANGSRIQVKGDPYLELQNLFESYKGKRFEGLPKFWGGALGYFSYDMGRYFEKLPELTVDDLEVPEACFMFCDHVICFDHLDKTMKIIVTPDPETVSGPEEAYRKAFGEITRIVQLIRHGKPGDPVYIGNVDRALQNSFQPECNVTKEQFEEMVRKCKEYIRAGDIFQANLSLRLGKKTGVDPFFLYKVLRQLNPSPYMSFIDFGDLHIVCSSPELLVRLDGNLAETRPIAGTRKRGADREEDLSLARELISNEKERAEHIMLVDLERNDLGRVCRYGTVEVDELMVIEEYSHVMHIVSNVRGRLAEGRDRFDLLRACFPGGTITGAPKIRSMEIIEELEPTRRGPYTGSIGFLGYAEEMEMNIVIRTLLVKDGKSYVQAGAGIVADSDPEREYFESLKKAEALLRTLEIADEMTQENMTVPHEEKKFAIGGELANA
ncbi:MAG: aminodeoxychorismate synthase component I [Firmicutes bacterium HGW-Firmicutes-14]|nr:MAG: aminodeoxychorismate synthase component I [Firmicutes bacterium HGW-Firmicutes-14]